MIRRPPRSTLDRSSAASDVYKRQAHRLVMTGLGHARPDEFEIEVALISGVENPADDAVSYTHLRAHETVLDIVCRLLLEKKQTKITQTTYHHKNIAHTPTLIYTIQQSSLMHLHTTT